MEEKKLKELCKRIRYEVLIATTNAGSGHPTSCLSAVELVVSLFFNGFYRSGDRFILSKGHIAPLLYSIYSVAGLTPANWIESLRKFGSIYEGHPTPKFPYTEIATGSLGHGLSVGVGMALGIKLRTKKLGLKIEREPNIWVLLGDSEMAEGQIWEAMETASYYHLNNLIGIIDVNRLGQYGETEEGWHLNHYARKSEAFGWEPIVVKDGHDLAEIRHGLLKLIKADGKPKMLIAKTTKGKGISFLEDKDDWHGKVLSKEDLNKALKELGKISFGVKGKIEKKINIGYQTLNTKSFPKEKLSSILKRLEKKIIDQSPVQSIATREAYGNSLVELGEKYSNLVVLDAEVANSTYENIFAKRFPDRFFEMFIAEENMADVALGLSKLGFTPFFSTFAAFLTQVFDQLRMAQYSQSTKSSENDLNLNIVGSHSGVSIGQDGPSQMGLEDIAMARSILNSTVLYPSDAVSTRKLTKIMAEKKGIFYLRLTREKTPIIYMDREIFEVGGSKVHKLTSTGSIKKKLIIITAGITLHEALKAQKELIRENIDVIVVDCYSIKPLDERTIIKLAREYNNVVVVEDHYPYGGLGEAISDLIVKNNLQIKSYKHLCVTKIPTSGTPEELRDYMEIDHKAIINSAKKMI